MVENFFVSDFGGENFLKKNFSCGNELFLLNAAARKIVAAISKITHEKILNIKKLLMFFANSEQQNPMKP